MDIEKKVQRELDNLRDSLNSVINERRIGRPSNDAVNQSVLSRLSGVGQPQISLFLAGKKGVSLRTIRKLQNGLLLLKTKYGIEPKNKNKVAKDDE